MLGHQPSGIRVIGRHSREALEGFSAVLVNPGPPESGIGKFAQPQPYAFGQLGGGLASKRQSQNLFWRHETVGNQPHHPTRHGFGLTAPSPRYDEQR